MTSYLEAISDIEPRMLKPSAKDIVIDARSGRISGAGLREGIALTTLRLAMRVLMPLRQFGFSYVARTVRTLLPSRRPMIFSLAPGALMRVPYCDAYWSILLLPGYSYEHSTVVLLEAARDIDYGFVDGGANYGYWSILASGPEAGGKAAVAVEAAPDTFRVLEDNRVLNDSRFSVLNRAIGATSGQHVRIFGAKHEARTTVDPADGSRPILECDTISLDDIAALPQFAGLDKFIVKLDVEGVEIAAFSGAARLLAGDTVFVYEDHGSDLDHATTRHALDVLKLRVFWLGRGRRQEITSPTQLAAIKKSRRFGYDMVATNSPFWIERLERLVDGSPE
ncbi:MULTISPECIES: FkbM family methyltransferase [Phyllobacteriaceae]|jgi:FkbM family methyltransferase|nr:MULTISPECIES: FkbM family methyltransferase [Mesorhizobium]MBN9236449.1 FkbM family methyltransferase [Mesorhizobium sp.]MDQ0329621.1 FkbM family methyltransferase [Mesorhizobium sp. YL-MeA3-2017]